jgi:hypothetical protein
VKNKIWNKNKYPIENSKPYLCPCVSWTIKIKKTHEKNKNIIQKWTKDEKHFEKRAPEDAEITTLLLKLKNQKACLVCIDYWLMLSWPTPTTTLFLLFRNRVNFFSCFLLCFFRYYLFISLVVFLLYKYFLIWIFFYPAL